MQRVPEPELMQNLDQVKAYAEADFNESDDQLLSRIQEYLCDNSKIPDSTSLIIDIGCGPGNLTERISGNWPTSKVIGLDGSEAMLCIARDRQKQKNKRSTALNIQYLNLNISLIGNEIGALEKRADLIVSNSFFHHMHNSSNFWKALKLFSHKGSVHFHRDLRRPSSQDEVVALQKKYLTNSPTVLIDDYLASLQAAFTVDEVKDQLRSEGLDHLRVYEVEDRYLEVVGIF